MGRNAEVQEWGSTIMTVEKTCTNSAIEVENSTLGVLITEPKHFDRVLAAGIEADCFQHPKNRIVFETIERIAKSGKNVDIVTLKSIMPGYGKHLLELSESFATTANMDNWLVLLKEAKAAKIMRAAIKKASTHSLSETADAINTLLGELATAQRLLADTKTRGTVDILTGYFEQMQSTGRDTIPYFSADDPASGLIRHSRREMHVIAANTGVGKTAFACGVVARQLEAGLVVAYFCFESDSEAIIGRMAAAVSGVSHYKAVYGSLNNADMSKFENGAKFIKKHAGNIFIRGVETGIMTAEAIRAEVKNIVAERGKLDVIVIDFLQAMSVRSDMRRQERHLQIAHIVTELHKLFIETNCAGIVLAQLNREGSKPGQLPGLEHLKDSSVIAQLAHTVSFLSRPQKSDYSETVKFYSRKTRNQQPFSMELAFDGTKYKAASQQSRYGKEFEPE